LFRFPCFYFNFSVHISLCLCRACTSLFRSVIWTRTRCLGPRGRGTATVQMATTSVSLFPRLLVSLFTHAVPILTPVHAPATVAARACLADHASPASFWVIHRRHGPSASISPFPPPLCHDSISSYAAASYSRIGLHRQSGMVSICCGLLTAAVVDPSSFQGFRSTTGRTKPTIHRPALLSANRASSGLAMAITGQARAATCEENPGSLAACTANGASSELLQDPSRFHLSCRIALA
jgi:hypothetical protein